jgi:hypothetical protein
MKTRILVIAGIAACGTLAIECPIRAGSFHLEQKFSLRKGASLLTALATFRGTGRAIVCDAVPDEVHSPSEVSEASLETALNSISEAFDLHWRLRAGTVTLNRRFSSSTAAMDVEVEELSASASDLLRLVSPFVPYGLGVEAIRDQNEFHKALTPDQLHAMANGGLPFDRLDDRQKRQWLRVNSANGYSSQWTEWGRTARFLAKWSQTSFHRKVEGPLDRTLWYRYPGEKGLRDEDSFHLVSAEGIIEASSHRPSSGERLDARVAPLPKNFEERVALTDGELPLGAVVTAIRKASGIEIEVPHYATQRKLLIFGNGATATSVLTALEDLYGWETRQVSARKWRLDRPRLAAAQNARELRAKLVRALPESARMVLRAQYRNLPLYLARFQKQADSLVWQINGQLGEAWQRAPVSALSSQTQRYAAAMLFEQQMSRTLVREVGQPEPYWWLVAPQSGWFTLEGVGPHPTLLFHVRRPDDNVDTWGWAVGTSTLKD